MTHSETIPMSVLDGSGDADDMIEVRFEWTPGTPESGRHSGPPEDYDPGSGDEFEIVSACYVIRDKLIPCGLAPHEEERVVEYLDENWDRPDDEPDPDWLRDQAIDDRLTDKGDPYDADI